VIEQVEPLFLAQLILAKGLIYVYRINIGERGGQSDPEIVTDQHELLEAVKYLNAGDQYAEIEDEADEEGETQKRRYYFLTAKPPDNKALEGMLDRALGKAVGLVELPADADAGTVIGFTFHRNEANQAGHPANS
jgi:hypothetical protein